MSPLAKAIYGILRKQAAEPDPRLTYAQLAECLRDLSDDFEYLHHRNRQLYAALGEVGKECRRLRLPGLPALVVRADTRRPGAAYIEGKCTGNTFQGEKIAAWRKEMETAQQATYPAR